MSLCSIRHRFNDEDLVAISPDYRVYVADRLLHERELLAARYERFRAA